MQEEGGTSERDIVEWVSRIMKDEAFYNSVHNFISNACFDPVNPCAGEFYLSTLCFCKYCICAINTDKSTVVIITRHHLLLIPGKYNEDE